MSPGTSVDIAGRTAVNDAAQAAIRKSTVESWTLYSIGVAVTILRIYARVRSVGFRQLKPEDFLVLVAMLFYSAQTALAYCVLSVAQGLANNGMTDAQRAALSVNDPEYRLRVIGSKIQVAGWTTYSVLIWSLKLSMLSFYLRLTEGLARKYRIPVLVGFGLLVGAFFASILAVFTACQPFHKYWQINPDPGNHCQAAISKPIIWASFASNVSTDIYLILIPIPMLWKSRLKLIKKIAATIVFGAGLLVLVCAILKSIFVLVDPINGAELAGAWGTRETFVAVITTNLPMVFHLLKSSIRQLLGTALDSTDRLYKSPSGFESSTRRRRVPPSVHHITANLTINESEERIVGDGVTLKTWTSNAASTPTPGTDDKPGAGGILVSNQIDVVHEDRGSEASRQHGRRFEGLW